MRIILSCDKYTPIRTMLKTVNMDNIADRLTRNVMIFLYKIINGNFPKYLNQFIVKGENIHSHGTRARVDHKATTQDTVFAKALPIYNKLPQSVKMSENVKAFARNYKKFKNSV